MRSHSRSVVRRHLTGRKLIWFGIVLLAVAVVLIGTIGALQDPSATSVTCEGMGTCAAAGGNWPTGWGWWVVIGVATIGVTAIGAGVTVSAVRRRRGRG